MLGTDAMAEALWVSSQLARRLWLPQRRLSLLGIVCLPSYSNRLWSACEVQFGCLRAARPSQREPGRNAIGRILVLNGLWIMAFPKICKPGRSKRICHVFPSFLSYALTVSGIYLMVVEVNIKSVSPRGWGEVSQERAAK